MKGVIISVFSKLLKLTLGSQIFLITMQNDCDMPLIDFLPFTSTTGFKPEICSVH